MQSCRVKISCTIKPVFKTVFLVYILFYAKRKVGGIGLVVNQRDCIRVISDKFQVSAKYNSLNEEMAIPDLKL